MASLAASMGITTFIIVRMAKSPDLKALANPAPAQTLRICLSPHIGKIA
jgi:hypothetical protein